MHNHLSSMSATLTTTVSLNSEYWADWGSEVVQGVYGQSSTNHLRPSSAGPHGLGVGASVSWKRFRRVRPQAACIVKGGPFVTELIGTAYDAFGQFAEVRRPTGARRIKAWAHVRNLQ
jgi:hypothetical protein